MFYPDEFIAFRAPLYNTPPRETETGAPAPLPALSLPPVPLAAAGAFRFMAFEIRAMSISPRGVDFGCALSDSELFTGE